MQDHTTHFAPGTAVTLDNRNYAIVCVDGEWLLLTDGHGESGWVRPFALAGSRRGPSTSPAPTLG